MSDTSNLTPINISLIAPSGAGKTTLIATIMRDTTKALPAPFKVNPTEASDQARIANFNRELQASLSAEEFSFNAGALAGTSAITMYNYKIEFKNIIQPFSLMDIPGGWLKQESRSSDEQWQQYLEHLQNSVALWVPIEAPLLMEAKTPDQKKKRINYLMTTDVRDVVEQWAKYRASEEHKDEPAILCLAPTKCETYFSKKANDRVPDNFFNAFIREYTFIINAAKEACPHCKILYTPVESIGCIKLQKVDWHINDNEASPSVNYKILSPYQQEIKGVEALMGAIYRFGADRIVRTLDEMHKETSEYRNGKDETFNNRGLFEWLFDFLSGQEDVKKAEIRELTNIVEGMREDLSKISSVLQELADRSKDAPFAKEL